jgi:hypothetical protein
MTDDAAPGAIDPRRDSGAVPIYGAELAARRRRIADDDALADEVAAARADSIDPHDDELSIDDEEGVDELDESVLDQTEEDWVDEFDGTDELDEEWVDEADEEWADEADEEWADELDEFDETYDALGDGDVEPSDELDVTDNDLESVDEPDLAGDAPGPGAPPDVAPHPNGSTHPNGAKHSNGSTDAGGGSPPLRSAHMAGGAHVRRRTPRRYVRGRGGHPAHQPDGRQRRGAAARIPVVALLVAALAGAVAVDRQRDGEAQAGAGTGSPSAGGGAAEVAPGALMSASPPVDAASSTWYCAAGTTGPSGFADHTVTVTNPTADDLTATLTVFGGTVATSTPGDDPATAAARSGDSADAGDTDGGAPAPVTQALELPAGREVSVRLGNVLPASLAAALVEVDGGGVAVEHSVRGRHGADRAPCSTTASPAWHFAWGATTRDARELVVLFNPFPSTATVDAVFVTEEGGREPVRLQGLPVPGHSVVGIDVGEDVTRSEQVAASFAVRSGRLVVERLQEYDGSLGPRGLTLTPGAPSAGGAWVFADGAATAPSPATPEPDAEDEDESEQSDDLITTERVVVYNPGEARAEVDVHVVPATDDGATGDRTTGDEAAPPPPQPFRLGVGAGRYEVVDLGAEDRLPAGTPHLTVVRSTNGEPVVAERVTVDTGPAPSERHRSRGRVPARRSELTASLGARLGSSTWTFPAPAHPPDDGTVAYVVVNPDPDSPVTVRLEPLDAAGSRPEPVVLAPGGRAVLAPGTAGDRGPNTDSDDEDQEAEPAPAPVSTVVEADGPVVVERIVRTFDGRRQSLGAGIPDAGDASLLDLLIAGS